MTELTKQARFGLGHKLAVLLAAIAAVCAVQAGEISFTGADASAPTDLSLPGNWDGGASDGYAHGLENHLQIRCR